MTIIQAKIHYLFHSGFSVETPHYFLIFDYWKNDRKSINNSLPEHIIDSIIHNQQKEIYVFVSHKHKDHFDPEIFKWNQMNSGIQYICRPERLPRSYRILLPEIVFLIRHKKHREH